ncbi:MAG: hypothetical protein GY811_20690 [Myxococcales bacterium]|nr:hypothetical protein [Myxococcales bacterium]
MLWWQGAQPQCAGGELNERTLRWGAVLWCKLPGQSVDANLQNDLGRLARCVHESVEAFQSEPGEDGLGKFLNRAKAEGLSPILCGAVRNDSEVRIYNGRTVLLERVVVKSLPDANGASRVRYRFGCEDCLVASETTIEVSL